ncbi:tannase feruloyl esterase protein [Rutstroemia sp. NJR-2017a BVV2]|nr:tannase feruloyl esterase protein [Rutstroemia sp. NJR-2017a BVV2]
MRGPAPRKTQTYKPATMLNERWQYALQVLGVSSESQFTMKYPTAASMLGLSAAGVNATCSSSSIPYPNLTGAQILSLDATPVMNYSLPRSYPSVTYTAPTTNSSSISFCNVTIVYTHPGEGDTIKVQVWLPASSSWNSRFMGTGGGGFATGYFDSALAPAIAAGYSAASTDGGHDPAVFSAEPWALLSPGNVNLYLLQDFASVALNDMTVLGKAVTESFYGVKPKYSYWNGCSTGGRQGHMMAQRYPTAYDGIHASAPAINWAQMVPATYWPQFVMNQLKVYPSACELNAITAAAVKACDELDGVADGVISAVGLCNFNASSVVGSQATCSNNPTQTVSSGAAAIAQAAWDGSTSSEGAFQWYGLTRNSPLTGLAGTTCDSSNQNCVQAPFQACVDWISAFIKKNTSFPITNMTHKEYDSIFHASVQQYTSIIGTNDPDLSEFRDAGGKMLAVHGLADQLIPTNGTVDYYQKVEKLDPSVRDYYRFYEAPGMGHCSGGSGAVPEDMMAALVKWVEGGDAPETLPAKTTTSNGTVKEIGLCQFPLVNAYKGGDINKASSYECRDSF